MIARPMGRQLQASTTRELIHFDFLKMTLSDDVQEYLLVLKDGFSGFTMLFPCQSCTTTATVEGLLAWFSIFGVANTWVSDRGTHFRNQVMTTLKTAASPPSFRDSRMRMGERDRGASKQGGATSLQDTTSGSYATTRAMAGVGTSGTSDVECDGKCEQGQPFTF